MLISLQQLADRSTEISGYQSVEPILIERILDKYGLSILVTLVMIAALWKGLPTLFGKITAWVDGGVTLVCEEFERQSKMLERQASAHEAVVEGLRKTFEEQVDEQRGECTKEFQRQREEWSQMLARYQDSVRLNVGDLTKAIADNTTTVGELKRCAEEVKRTLAELKREKAQ